MPVVRLPVGRVARQGNIRNRTLSGREVVTRRGGSCVTGGRNICNFHLTSGCSGHGGETVNIFTFRGVENAKKPVKQGVSRVFETVNIFYVA
jgi:hypothetical protein